MMNFVWIGLGSFLGANSRYLVALWAARVWGADFPYGTLLVNVGGSFILALFLTLTTGKLTVSPEARLFVGVGFLGSFTTFSSFSYEWYQLIAQGRWWAAGLDFLGNTALGLTGVIAGIAVAGWLQGLGGE